MPGEKEQMSETQKQDESAKAQSGGEGAASGQEKAQPAGEAVAKAGASPEAAERKELSQAEIDAIFGDFDLGVEEQPEQAPAEAKGERITREEHERALAIQKSQIERELSEAKKVKEEAEEEGDTALVKAVEKAIKPMHDELERIKKDRADEQAARTRAEEEEKLADRRDAAWDLSGRIAAIAVDRFGLKAKDLDADTLEFVQDTVFTHLDRLCFRSPGKHPVQVASDNVVKLIERAVGGMRKLVPASPGGQKETAGAAGKGSETASSGSAAADSGSETRATTPSSGGLRRGTASEKPDMRTEEGRKSFFSGLRSRAKAELMQAGRFDEGGDPDADPFGRK